MVSAHAASYDASEAIFLNTAGHICRHGTNIFMVFEDKVITPPLSSGPLAGITSRVDHGVESGRATRPYS